MSQLRERPILLVIPLVALLVALLVIVSRNDDDDVAVVDTTEAADTTTSTEAESDVDAEVDADADIEAETDAMGEDDTDPPAGSVDEEEPAEVAGDPVETDSGVTIDDPALAAAYEAGRSGDLGLPFLYITADQDCDGCAETVSLYYVPSEEKASVLVLAAAYEDGTEIDTAAVDPTLLVRDPRFIAEQLAAAGATEADYSIDVVSGLVTSWTIDGNTVTLRCLQVDTRPVDLRSEVCRDSLIG